MGGRAVITLCSCDDLVVDVSEIHDMANAISSVDEPALDDIVGEKGSKVSNVGVVIDGGAA